MLATMLVMRIQSMIILGLMRGIITQLIVVTCIMTTIKTDMIMDMRVIIMPHLLNSALYCWLSF
jgi:hypothetical protein